MKHSNTFQLLNFLEHPLCALVCVLNFSRGLAVWRLYRQTNKQTSKLSDRCVQCTCEECDGTGGQPRAEPGMPVPGAGLQSLASLARKCALSGPYKLILVRAAYDLQNWRPLDQHWRPTGSRLQHLRGNNSRSDTAQMLPLHALCVRALCP